MNAIRPAGEAARNTFSVCPVCLRRVPAVLRKERDVWRIHKECDRHGGFSAVVWRGEPCRADWIGDALPLQEEENPACPTACGLCAGHRQETCCVLLEITQRCNLGCRFCFAGSGEQGSGAGDPSLDLVTGWIADIASRGKTFLQLSGGEPALRDDLPEIVRRAKALGCEYVQLNSNGLRLAQEEEFVAALARAGLSFVFMQFDGLSDDIHIALRGRALMEQKLRAIENCGKYNIGVTLVPTVVPGVNDGAIGAIVRFAVERSPVVRGVHFQPVSYFGRHPCDRNGRIDDSRRMTLPEVFRAVFDQAGDLVPPGSIVPSRCDHAACGFHGGYIVTPQGLTPLSPAEQPACCPDSAAERNRRFVGSRWLRPAMDCCAPPPDKACCEPQARQSPADGPCDLNSLDGFLQRARSHAFTISCMAFQDAHTLDLERLRQCSLHVYDRGRIVPFCSYYIMGQPRGG